MFQLDVDAPEARLAAGVGDRQEPGGERDDQDPGGPVEDDRRPGVRGEKADRQDDAGDDERRRRDVPEETGPRQEAAARHVGGEERQRGGDRRGGRGVRQAVLDGLAGGEVVEQRPPVPPERQVAGRDAAPPGV